FPGSLVFWGIEAYLKLRQELPLATQIPLLHMVARHEAWRDLRVPQSGWMHEPRPGQAVPDSRHGPMRNTFKRTHRWAKVGRHELYWHRPLVAFLSAKTNRPATLPDAPLGYLTAYREDKINVDRPIELWPRLLHREAHVAAVRLFEQDHQRHPYQTTLNVRK